MQLRGKPAASIVYFGNLCTNNLFKCAYNVLSPRTATVWVKKRDERGGRSHSSVTLRRREEEEPTERRKRRQREQTQRGGSQAVHFLYSKKASSAHRGLCAPLRLFFFFTLSPSFLFFFLQNTPKRHAREQQLCVLYNRLCQHLPKPAFAQAKQQIQKEEKDFFSHPSRSGNKSTPFTPQTCAMFPHAPDGWQRALRSRRNFPTQYWRKETVAQRTSPAPTRLHARLRLLVQSTARLQVACSRQEAKLISEAPLPSCHN